ncbi:MAG: ferredoxin [Actinomycetota bacterium]|jgi:ferredoxin|nr:ferredoxin [Actinomycetota bacterium]
MTVRVSIDLTRCRGHGMCALLAPDDIGLDSWGFGRVDHAELAEPRQVRRVRRAAAACPRQAIAIREVSSAVSGTDESVRAPWVTWRAP